MTKNEALDIATDMLQRRNGREYGEGHRHDGHHGEQRGVRQHDGMLATIVVHEMPVNEAGEIPEVSSAGLEVLPH
jgi:hypothetical protein